MLKNKLFTILAITLFVYLVTKGINLPFVGPNATNYNLYSLIARNYNKFGLAKVSLAPITSVANQLPESPKFYLHHPPLFPIIQSFSFKLFSEQFWSGRLVMVLFAVGSLLILSQLSKPFAAVTYLLIPASTVFGRMIGQETPLLFFIFLTVFLLKRHLKTTNNRYLLGVYIAVILGTLTDWPMTYFTVSLLPWLYRQGKSKLSIQLILISTMTALSFLFYIYWLTGSFADLVLAIKIRSLGQLLTYDFWFFKWILIILLRILVYFNPLIVIAAVINLLINRKQHLLISLLLFGFIHIGLYPEGSFGHPYWVYYLIPFFALSSSRFLVKLYQKSPPWLIIFILTAFFYAQKVEAWKFNEIKANLFRYELAKIIAQHVQPFSPVVINYQGAVDADMLEYQFNLNPISLTSEQILSSEEKPDKYFFSCSGCNESDPKVSTLLNHYDYQELDSSPGKLFIINLKQRRESALTPSIASKNLSSINSPPNYPFSPKSIYSYILEYTQAPQL